MSTNQVRYTGHGINTSGLQGHSVGDDYPYMIIGVGSLTEWQVIDCRTSNRSDRYTYIPTIDVLNGLQREGFKVMQAVQTRTRIADNREFTKHMLRLRHRDVLDRPLVAGQEIPEIVLVNSRDGTSAYKITGDIFRLICSNSMVIGDTSFECSVRHSGDVISNVIEGSFEVVKGIERVMPVINTWKQIKLEAPEKPAFAKAARALRWDDDRGDDLWRRNGW